MHEGGGGVGALGGGAVAAFTSGFDGGLLQGVTGDGPNLAAEACERFPTALDLHSRTPSGRRRLEIIRGRHDSQGPGTQMWRDGGHSDFQSVTELAGVFRPHPSTWPNVRAVVTL